MTPNMNNNRLGLRSRRFWFYIWRVPLSLSRTDSVFIFIVRKQKMLWTFWRVRYKRALTQNQRWLVNGKCIVKSSCPMVSVNGKCTARCSCPTVSVMGNIPPSPTTPDLYFLLFLLFIWTTMFIVILKFGMYFILIFIQVYIYSFWVLYCDLDIDFI